MSPAPGCMEMDLVAHERPRSTGSFAHTLSSTDIATSWTECVPLLVRGSSLVLNDVDYLSADLSFPRQRMDAGNGSEFLNDALNLHSVARGIEFTRSWSYHKHGQAWIEDKNGAVVRRFVGYGRLERVGALGRLYHLVRPFVKSSHSSLELKEKARIGSRPPHPQHPTRYPPTELKARVTAGFGMVK